MESHAAEKLATSPSWRGARRAGWVKMATKSKLLNTETGFLFQMNPPLPLPGGDHPYPSQEGMIRLFFQESFSVELTLL